MKQKNHNKIFRIIQSGIVAMFLLAGVFGLTPPIARAAVCTYAVQLSGDKTAVTAGDTVNFTAIVTRQAQDLVRDCGSTGIVVSFVFNQKSGSSSGFTGFGLTGNQFNIAFTDANGTAGKAVFPFYLGNLNRSILPQTNLLEFRADLQGGSVLTSNVFRVNITGEVGSSGTLSPRITFQPSGATFNNGDAIDVCETVTTARVNALPPAIQSVHFSIYVNDPKAPVWDFDISRAELLAEQWCSSGLTVSAANGFINGTNTITGKFVVSGSGSGLGEGSATLQVKGLAAAAPPPGTPPPAPGTPPIAPGVLPAPVVPSGNCNGPTPNPDYCLYNPLPVNSLGDTLLLIMRAFLGMIAVWAVAFIVIGGFRLVVSSGNEEQVTAAKKTITWAVVGLVIALLSFSIIAILQNILGTSVQDVKTKTSSVLINRKIGMADGSEIGKSYRKEDGL